jgi:mannose-6-phosphate isomerase-like protein (cupin superfamily)
MPTPEPAVPRYVVRAEHVPPYHPANHTGTTNRRLIGRDTVGATQVEMLLGVIERDEGVPPHAHPGIEQVGYLLAGRAVVEIGAGADAHVSKIGPGNACFFPADVMHKLCVVGDEPLRILVIYAPPYEEAPHRLVRAAATRAETTNEEPR